jgi:iron complex outermembrane receptor protein
LLPIAAAARGLAASLVLIAAVDGLAADNSSVDDKGREKSLGAVVVTPSADASAEGLTKSFAGGQVARGGRVGLLGNQDIMDTPFSSAAYTSQLIQDQQAKSVADVLLNDPTVRSARGFGNFQELYMIRGFPVPSDDMTYNGLYGVLPRQYVTAELIERVEVLRGPNAFLNGGTGAVSGFGIGGTVNVLPKRAGNEPLNQITAGIDNGGHGLLATDISRRFGPDQSTGLRINAARRDGSGTVKNEDRELSLLSVGADFRGRGVRLSADAGYQSDRINAPRPSVTPSGGIPLAPEANNNFAQSWTFSAERSLFASARAELDITESTLVWAAVGLRNGDEQNSLATPTATADGATTAYRWDNLRKDKVRTAELGLRGNFITGTVNHTMSVSAAVHELESRTAYAVSTAYDANWSPLNAFQSNLYAPVAIARPALTSTLDTSPPVTELTRSTSFAFADTITSEDQRARLTVGARHQHIDSTSYGTNYTKARLTPMAGFSYKLQHQVSLYANYIEGLTKGETAPGTAINAGQSLSPYTSKQKEIGVKYDGGSIGAGIALFAIDKPFGMVNDSNTFVAGGEQRNQGIELSLFGEAARGVRLLAGLTVLDAKILESEDDLQNGKRAIGVPRHMLNFGVDADVLGVQGMAVNARAVYTGAQYADANNTLSIPSWTRIDVGARYVTEINKQLVTFRARADNLFDRNYWASTGGYPGAGYLVLGAPRTLTVSATVDF